MILLVEVTDPYEDSFHISMIYTTYDSQLEYNLN